MSISTSNLVLYHFQSCPFCRYVRQAIQQMGLDIEMRDTLQDSQNRQDLIQGGGKSQVPCLLITDEQGQQQWLYESADIVRYLEQHFG